MLIAVAKESQRILASRREKCYLKTHVVLEKLDMSPFLIPVMKSFKKMTEEKIRCFRWFHLSLIRIKLSFCIVL